MAEGGRGLAMVAACTSRWGFAEAYPGRTVWAEATWPVPVPSPGDPAKITRAARAGRGPLGSALRLATRSRRLSGPAFSARAARLAPRFTPPPARRRASPRRLPGGRCRSVAFPVGSDAQPNPVAAPGNFR